MSILANGDLIKLGTLFMGSTKIARPTKPWRNDNSPYSGAGNGNIVDYAAGQTLDIRNTDASDANKMQWVEVNDGGKKYLVADRVWLSNISWNDLDAQGLISGKEITFDGQQFLLRVLTGGTNYRSGTDRYSGGKLPNEWDHWIENTKGLSGLPTPTAGDLKSNAYTDSTVFNDVHNQLWNWGYMYSWAQEIYEGNTAARARRGHISARFCNYNDATTRHVIIGWRPVLEVLNSPPEITGPSTNLGDKQEPFKITYQVSDPENDKVEVVEKLNGSTIQTRSDVDQGVDLDLQITKEQWSNLPMNEVCNIDIVATDDKGASSTRTYTFRKTNAAPTSVAVEPKGTLEDLYIVETLTPIFVWRFEDPDAGDRQSAYQVIVENTNNQVVHDSGKKASTQSFYQVPQETINWGDRLKWKVRVWDKYDVPSEYSFQEFFMPNRPPNVTNLRPGSDDELNPVGSSLNPKFEWDFEDLDIEAQAAYQLLIYKPDDSLVYDSSKIFKSRDFHDVPEGTLAQGQTYYAIVKVWDPNDLLGESDKAYIKTNATPSSPILTGPTDNYRTTLRPTLVGLVGTDPEDDGMHFVIQISTDPNFEQYALEKSSNEDRIGWQVNGYDMPVEGVKNDQQGQSVTYTTQVDLDMNKTYYWRMAAVDASTNAIGEWSDSRRFRAGNELVFEIKNPINTAGVAARRILFAMDYVLPTDGTNKANIKVEFSNNALDLDPTWEDATAEFLGMDYYDFVNTEKTATEFAIGVKVTVKANDSKGPLSIDALGLTFD